MSESDEIKVGDIVQFQTYALVHTSNSDGSHHTTIDKRIKSKKIGTLKVGDYVIDTQSRNEMVVTGVFFDLRRVAAKNWNASFEYPLSDIVLSSKANYEAAEAKYCEGLLKNLATETLMAEVVRRHNAAPKP